MGTKKHVALCGGLLAGAGAALGIRAWVRERKDKSVFPAAQAASLLNPARRLIQPPARTVTDLGVARGEHVLEVGPGPGYFTAHAARAAGSAGTLVAADLQPAMLHQLRARLAPDVVPQIRLAVMDVCRLPFRDAAFDRVFLVAVMGEVPQPERALAELRRVLRPGGEAAFCETINDPDYVRESVLREMCWRVGLEFLQRRRNALGYTARFRRPN